MYGKLASSSFCHGASLENACPSTTLRRAYRSNKSWATSSTASLTRDLVVRHSQHGPPNHLVPGQHKQLQELQPPGGDAGATQGGANRKPLHLLASEAVYMRGE